MAHKVDNLNGKPQESWVKRDRLEDTLIKLNQQERKITLLNNFNSLLNRTIELEELIKNSLQYFLSLNIAQVGVTFLFDAKAGILKLQAADGAGCEVEITEKELQLGQGLAGQAAALRKVVKAVYPQTELRASVYNTLVPVAAEIHFPLLFYDQLLGVISLGKLGDEDFSTDEIELLEIMASQEAIALNNASSYLLLKQSYEELQEQSRRVQELNAQLQTERDQLIQERDKLKAISNTINEGFIMLDLHRKVVYLNKCWGEFFDCKDVEALIHQPERRLRELVLATIVEKEMYSDLLEHLLTHHDEVGALRLQQTVPVDRVLSFYSAPVRDYRNAIIGRLLVYHDITKEAEIDRMKSELISTVSHEMRTPLSSVLGFAELLLHRSLDERTIKTYVEVIYKEARRLSRLVNDLLDLQRLEAGSVVLERKAVFLPGVLHEAVRTCSEESTRHHLVLDVPTDLPPVWCDADKIMRVMVNLLSNAVKYSPGGGEIRVSARVSEEMVVVSVQDHGLGIPDEARDKLFTRFFRIDNSDRRGIGGTGLGLAICKEIITAHDGEIWVDSVYGQGSTFSFTLPIFEKEVQDYA